MSSLDIENRSEKKPQTWPAGTVMVPIGTLVPYENNARTHSRQQIKKIASSIDHFGFVNPVLIDENNRIIAGHGRVRAAKRLGWKEVPTLRVEHLSEVQKRAYILADNRLAEEAGWDSEILAIEFQGLLEANYSIEYTGFEIAQVDSCLEAKAEAAASEGDEESVPLPQGRAVTELGDLWCLGSHRLLCGDATSGDAYARLLGLARASMVFTDPPYNVPISGHVSGLGKVQHREFAMAVGEMSRDQFQGFLGSVFGHLASYSTDGAIHFVCMDWRHMGETLDAGMSVYAELKNLCVWVKANGGMGSFYRSRHELVFAFKNGTAPHINNFGLGQSGRYRTNVWEYSGANSFGKERDASLAMHPTVKPVDLVADAIKDCSKRRQIVLDPFAGSGTTVIAAEKTGRRAFLLELDPLYCDTIIRRWQSFTGQAATYGDSQLTFDETEEIFGVDIAPDRDGSLDGEDYVPLPASRNSINPGACEGTIR